jgi:RNA polymerase sigma-70 factor (ECF subfamily)
LQQAAKWTGSQVFHAEPPQRGGPVGLISRLPALRTQVEGGAGVSDEAGRAEIERARSGDPEALGAVFHVYRPDVRRLCRRILGDEAAAEDAVAEAFLRAQARIAGYDAGRPFHSWLLAIAAHHCIDLLRRRSTEKRLFEDRGVDPAELADRGPSPLQQIMRAEERTAVLAAVDALAPKYRLPIVLRHFADLDYDAIGELLGISRNQVGTLLFRAKRRLRADLGGRTE